MEDLKVCSKCGKAKLLFCFGTRVNSKGVTVPVAACKKCTQDKRELSKAETALYNKNYRQRKKAELGEEGYKQYRREESLKYYDATHRELRNDRHKIKYDPEAAKEYRIQYQAKFYEEHGITYYEHVRPRKLEYKRKNKARIKAWAKQYIEKNKLILKAKAAQYYLENKEYIDRRNKQYYEANTEAHRIRSFNTYAKRKNAAGEFTHEDRMFLYKIQEGKCKYCFVLLAETQPNLDHQVPIAQGGSNAVENIAITCPECNRSKGPRTHEEFLEFLEIAHPKKYRNYIKNHMLEMPNYYVWNSTIDVSMQYSERLQEAA